jgi:hypothetical protein
MSTGPTFSQFIENPNTSEDLVSKKIEAINAEIERKNREAEQLLQYLTKQQELAKFEEEQEEDSLKKQGIIVGQHIPSLPSKLNLNPSELAEYETFSSTLLVARDLVQQNRTNFLRRTGNLPISDLAESRREANQKYVSQQDPDVPHYLEMTRSAKLREDRVSVRFAETIQQTKQNKSPTRRDDSNTAKGPSQVKTHGHKKVISAKERLEHENVLKSINHKLNYLRNPRNNPNAVTKMLVKPKDFFNTLQQQNSQSSPSLAGNSVHGSEHGGGGVSAASQKGSIPSQGPVSVPSSHPDDSSHSASSATSIASALKSKYSKFIKLTNNPLFVCEPSNVLFMDFELGKKYNQTISFRNISAVSRTVRILQPKLSNVFSISPLKYPPNCAGGMVAPGMSVSCVLSFVPNALGDFEDFIAVDTEAGSTKVMIKAQREPPNLSIPTSINLGYCLVGDAQRSAFGCMNTGGTGRFTIIEKPEDAAYISSDYEGSRCLRISPFTIYPTQFDLQKGESIELIFEFVPLVLGLASRTFAIYCDNGQIREFTVQATAKEINVSMIEINRIGFDEKDSMVYHDLHFNQVCLGTEMSQNVMVANDTGIPIEYEWVWLDANDEATLNEWNIQGQDWIVRRQDEHRPITVLDSRGQERDLLVTDHDGRATDAPVDHSLLRSIKESFNQRTGDGSGGMNDNNVSKREGFEIIPARGVLAGEGAATFKIIYSPLIKPGNTLLRAVMMIKSIPKASLPTIDQANALQLLHDYGHGRYPRLLSWLEDIGNPVPVERYQVPNGSWSTTKSILSLSSLVNLIISHAMDFGHALPFLGEEQEHELAEKHQQQIDRFNRWIRNVIKHVYEFRKKEAIPDDGSISSFNSKVLRSQSRSTAYSSENDRSRSIPNDEPRAMETIDLFEWFENDTDSNRDPKIPRLILPVQLYYEEPESTESDEEFGHIEEDYDPDLREIVDEDPNASKALPSLREFLPEHREILSEIWVDSNNALMLFGDYIDWLLNEKVQHEAIDYLKESSLNHLASINFIVHGDSYLQHLTVQPPCLEIGGKLSLGKEWTGEVLLTNHTDAPIQLFINCQDLVIRKFLTSTSNNLNGHNSNDLLLSEALMAIQNVEDHFGIDDDQKSVSKESSKSNNVLKQDIAIYSDYERLLVMPHSTEKFVFTIVVNVLGKYQIQLPVVPIDSVAVSENILLEVNTSGPKVRFEIAEVDIGLLGVGGEVSHQVSFSNEGDVPIMFMMKPTLHVDNAPANNQGKKVGSFLAAGSSSRPNTHREGGQPLSARSNISRQSSIHSDDFSVADSNATSNNGDFKIELKNATVTLEPSSGIVEAKSTMTVTVTTKAGKVPQRIRGMLENRVYDAGGKLELTRQFINLRGEVQSPKILLYPMHHNLGSVYIGRTVSFSFTLENICNLPTKFKFLRPGGQSSMYTYSLSPSKGSLEAKEKLTIHGTFTATNSGMIDDVISCKLFGMTKPLGFVLKAFGKGITLEFINAVNDPALPPVIVKPLANPTDVQLPNNEKPPDPHPVEPMMLGDEVPLYERRSFKFYIRNLSAIPAPFAIQPRKYCVMEKDWKGTLSVASASTTSSFVRPARTDLVLAPQEDGVNKFQSEAGKMYIGSMVNRREDRKFLKSGFGASYLVDCVQGELPPWSVKEINIHAFNDIPGCYDDFIDVSLFENDIVRKFNLPIKMKVEGCPVVIEKSSLGMTVIQPGDTKHPIEFEGRQLLSLGEICEHGPQLRREFYVRNNGSKVGKIAWAISGLAANRRGPLKVGLRVNGNGTVKTHYRFWSDIAKETPFKIEPMDGFLKPYSKQRFTLTMTRNSPAGLERAELIAKVAMKDEDNELELMSLASQSSDGQPSVVASSTIATKPKEKFTLKLLVEGNYVHPKLIVDKHTFTAPFAETRIADSMAINLKAKATLLFSSGGKLSHACSKLVTITNPLETEIVINAFTDGPYVIRDNQDNKEKNKHVASGATIATVSSIGAGEAGTVVAKQSTSQGKPIHMLPHVSILLFLLLFEKVNQYIFTCSKHLSS